MRIKIVQQMHVDNGHVGNDRNVIFRQVPGLTIRPIFESKIDASINAIADSHYYSTGHLRESCLHIHGFPMSKNTREARNANFAKVRGQPGPSANCAPKACAE